MKSNFYTTMKTPIGELVLTSSGEEITGLYTPEHSFYEEAKKGVNNPKPFREAVKQLKEYFDGKRKTFELPIASVGTEFQKRIWKSLSGIEFGKTKSYGEIAKSLKTPNASRAVGHANSKNPVCIIVPCHRVIGANGKLTGYAGGLQAKQWLLNHESKSMLAETRRIKI
jgi:methylated-DNA-[protein]-cysteine S-methyltransferase